MSNAKQPKPTGPTGPGTRTDANAGTKPGSGSDSPRGNGERGRPGEPNHRPDRDPGAATSSAPPATGATGPNAGTRTDANAGTKPTGSGARTEKVADSQTDFGETFVIQDSKPKSKGGRPTGFSPKAAQEEKKASSHEYNLVMADAAADVIDGLVRTFIAPTAIMDPAQKKLFTEPLVRMLDRMAPKILDDMQKYADPVLLGVALVSYGGYAMSERAKMPKRPSTVPMPQQQAQGGPGPVTLDEIPTGAEVLAVPSQEIIGGLGGGQL